jgi:hypothetical protein
MVNAVITAAPGFCQGLPIFQFIVKGEFCGPSTTVRRPDDLRYTLGCQYTHIQSGLSSDAQFPRMANNSQWRQTMPDSDVKLVPGQVIAQALDFCLDSQDPSRRHNATPFRRALVHDFQDGLTLNWGGDYPGGVTIQGMVTMPGQLDVQGKTTLKNGLELFGDARIEGRLQVRKLIVTVTTTIMGPQHAPVPVTTLVDVAAELATLKQKVAELEKKIG